jgi:type I restriction-modification system DNA methylase subunit
MTEEELRLQREIEGYNTYEKRKDNDEVFTPPHLIEEMLDKLDPSVWSDPTKTWLDPCAGIGNFSVLILKRLMEGLKTWQPNGELRKKHILEKMLYHVEMNPESIQKLQKVLNPTGKYKLNIRCSDFLTFENQKKKTPTPLF